VVSENNNKGSSQQGRRLLWTKKPLWRDLPITEKFKTTITKRKQYYPPNFPGENVPERGITPPTQEEEEREIPICLGPGN